MQSRTIILLSDNPGEDYVGRIRSGVSKACSAAGFTLEAINLYRQTRTVMDVLDAGGYGGIVLTPPISDDRQVLSRLEKDMTPFVRIAPLLDLDRGNTVAMDEFDAASSVVGKLTGVGHRRIGIVRGPNSQLVSMRRYNGYANAIGAHGIKVDQGLVVQGDFTRESGRKAAAALFAAGPTAIFASNDDMAAGIIDAAQAAGVRIPEDISIVGYDDNAVATQVRPQLTTVRQPCEAMGEAAGRAVIETVKNPRKPLSREIIPYQIVERQSVAPPPTQ